ncbi:MAG: addiction module protein [Verrucomicrobiota bacterium]|nr:addiction module protein [Verrucomicrobiota bacterium]
MSVAEMKQGLSKLTNAERIELMNAVWESIENKDEEIESPAWHGEVLAEREAEIQSGTAKFLSLEELKERFGR